MTIGELVAHLRAGTATGFSIVDGNIFACRRRVFCGESQTMIRRKIVDV